MSGDGVSRDDPVSGLDAFDGDRPSGVRTGVPREAQPDQLLRIEDEPPELLLHPERAEDRDPAGSDLSLQTFQEPELRDVRELPGLGPGGDERGDLEHAPSEDLSGLVRFFLDEEHVVVPRLGDQLAGHLQGEAQRRVSHLQRFRVSGDDLARKSAPRVPSWMTVQPASRMKLAVAHPWFHASSSVLHGWVISAQAPSRSPGDGHRDLDRALDEIDPALAEADDEAGEEPAAVMMPPRPRPRDRWEHGGGRTGALAGRPLRLRRTDRRSRRCRRASRPRCRTRSEPPASPPGGRPRASRCSTGRRST